jgi:hypothetical protein
LIHVGQHSAKSVIIKAIPLDTLVQAPGRFGLLLDPLRQTVLSPRSSAETAPALVDLLSFGLLFLEPDGDLTDGR